MEEVSNEMQARVEVRNPWLAILPLMLGAFVGMFSETALNIALPQLMKALAVGQSSIQWLVTGYMLVIGIVLPLSSLLTKWFTTKQLVISGLAFFIIGSLISGFGVSFSMVLVGRMIQGVGTGIILPLMFTVAMLVFPPNKLGSVNGILALVIAFFSVENVNQITKPKIDFLSIILSIIGFSGLIAGTSFASHAGWLSIQVLGCLIVGILALVFYVRRQLKLNVPILNMKVFKHYNFTLGAGLVMIDFGIILSAMYLLPQYLQNGLLVAVALTGIIMLPGGLVNALVSAVAGRMYDNFGAKWPTRIGFLIAFVGAFLLSIVTTSSPIWYVILAHIILMIGTPLAMSPAQTSALNSLKGIESADGSAILNTVQQIVGALATALATSFLTLGRNSVGGAEAFRFTNGVHYGMYFMIALTVVGFIIALFVKDDGDYSK
ncbi:MFS transporter [Lactobacillus intestinalis]|uniref:MFS transporter n=1 Tax=Lactobacillus intestinalis TaxID=151781 RepID=UPI0025A9AB91|nr:MFS transporter [Lactobacillus intestinalis]